MLKNIKICQMLEKEKPKLHVLLDSPKTQDFHTNINLLKEIEMLVKPSYYTLETGAGWSTVVFSYKKTHHLVINPIKQEWINIQKYCHKKGISATKTKFIARKSEEFLPTLPSKEFLDFILIDGNHAFPFPIIDWHYSSQRLKINRYLAVDDIDIKSCNILYLFLKSDKNWRLIKKYQNHVIFLKIGREYPSWWRQQNFSHLKIGPLGHWENIKFRLIERDFSCKKGDFCYNLRRKGRCSSAAEQLFRKE